MSRSVFVTRFLPLALCFIAFFAPLSIWGSVAVTKQPTDAEVSACVEAAKTAVGATPIDCMQHTIITGNCDDVPQPAPAQYVVNEPKPLHYADPINDAPGTGMVFLPDGSAQYTFTDVGTSTNELCPDKQNYALFDTVVEKTGAYPDCWVKRQKLTVSCPAP